MTYLVCLIAVVYIGALVVAARWFAEREGYYSTVVVFGMSAFVYYLAIPVEMALFGDEVAGAGEVVFLSPAEGVQIGVMGLMAFVAFVAGYSLSKFTPLADKELPDASSEPEPAGRMPRSLIILGCGCVVLLLAGFVPQLLSVSSYEIGYEVTYDDPVFSLLCTYAVMALALVAALLVCRHRARPILGAIAVMPLFLWGIYSVSKGPIFIAVLAVATYFSGKRSQNPRLILLVAICVALLILLSPVFSMYRAGYTLSEAASEYYYGVGRTDARGPIFSLSRAISEHRQFALGATYFDNLFLWIPRFVWPNRPLDLAESFARDHMTGWSPGQGLGYSPLAESYVNFGWFGPVIQYFLIGLLWGKGWALIRRVFAPVSRDYWRAIYCVIGFYLLAMMHRGPTPATTKTMLQFLAPLILLRFVFDSWRMRPATIVGPAMTGRPTRGDRSL